MSPPLSDSDHQFEAPGPGFWELDTVHFPRPVTRYWVETQPDAFRQGFAATASYYGLLVETMEFRYVHGFAYRSAVPIAEDRMTERFRRAADVFGAKLWRAQVREWDERAKPDSIRTHKELQSVDPDTLSDSDLIGYLRRCRDHHAAMITQHRRFTGAATIPTGDLLAHVSDWTGLSHGYLLGMLRGSSPVSGGGSAELERLITTVRQDPSARQLLEGNADPGKVLEALSSLETPAGQALSDYLAFAGYRLLDGFDISGPYALELPEALVRAIVSSVAGRAAEGADVEDLVSDVRRQVPDKHRAEFNELLDEARLTYRIRDERGVFSDIWAAGIMRRAVLAAGRRLTERGRIHAVEHLIDAGIDEMTAMLSKSGGPDADDLSDRCAYRVRHSAKEAPPHLGSPPPPPPDRAGLPPAAARVERAMAISLGALFGSSQSPSEAHCLRGLAASGGVYEGPARVISGPAEFGRITQGDVLVTESTTEAFNILLPVLGAIVTDAGGLLSHSAIVAREYGIPGVVGTRNATQQIRDGARVRVDGDAGEVTLPA
jgi:pyruvate,water dikinase